MEYSEINNNREIDQFLKEPSTSFRELKIWRKAHELVLQIYKISRLLPDEERFGLVSQIRRAGVSIPANIVEGYKRRGLADKVRILNYSQSSLEEVNYFLLLINDLYQIETSKEQDDCIELGKILNGYISAIANKKQNYSNAED